jgi:hypothetical protein
MNIQIISSFQTYALKLYRVYYNCFVKHYIFFSTFLEFMNFNESIKKTEATQKGFLSLFMHVIVMINSEEKKHQAIKKKVEI